MKEFYIEETENEILIDAYDSDNFDTDNEQIEGYEDSCTVIFTIALIRVFGSEVADNNSESKKVGGSYKDSVDRCLLPGAQKVCPK